LSIENQVYASERDFVASFLLPKLREAAERLGFLNVIDFHVEKAVDGIPDLSAEKGGKGLFIVEAKFKKKVARVERDIEPLDPDVVEQAVKYAAIGGFPYFTTCNTKRIVLFQFKPGTKAIESVVAALDYEKNPDWAETLLKTSLELVPVQLRALDDTLVDELHDAFGDLYSEFSLTLRKKLQDPKFRERYDEWLESQGIKRSDEANRLIAEQTAYLQLNKLLFYQVIRAIYPDRLRPLKVGEDRDVAEALSEFYQDALRIDYTPVYQSDVMSEIPLTPRAEERIRTLLDTLNEFDFSKMESDFIGRIYEKLIPPTERKRLGQFYTPSGIVDLIVSLTITEPDDVVLDPGCGSGSFLVRAYHRLSDLNTISKTVTGPMAETYHRQILKQLYGIDINQFPAHLTVINLAVQNPKARIEKINTIVSDFFDVKPGARTLFGFKGMTTEGEPTVVTLPSAFDATVANPPYIRQELLGDKEKVKIRSLIEGEYPGKLSIGKPHKESEAEIILDKQSDIYVYFYIHAMRFLKEGGRLGFISSNKWLEVGYGIPFQKFLLEHARILLVMEFDRAVFPDAEVNTAVVILQKESNKLEREKNLVKFVRLKKKIDLKRELELIEAKESYEDERVRVNIVGQGEMAEGKWNIHLRAPPLYGRILRSGKTKPLGTLAEVFRGPVTGYNDYFILSKQKAEEWGIEPRFLKPCISSPKKVKGLAIRKEGVEDFFFFADRSKRDLAGTRALKYIEYGENLEVEVTRGAHRGRRKLPKLETIAMRDPWYVLPELKEAPILFQYMIDERATAFWNIAKAHAPNIIHYVIPNEDSYIMPLLGYLNSSIGALMVELHGRSYGGGVLKIEVYELKDLPVIDPQALSHKESGRIAEVFALLVRATDQRVEMEAKMHSMSMSASGKGKEAMERVVVAEREARRELDDAIYDILGLREEERRQIAEALRELQELRRLRAQV